MVPLLALALMMTSCATARRASTTAKPIDCCATNLPAAAFTDKSLYQLDSTWTNDAGTPVKLGSLQGRAQLVVMFFASCTYACPILLNDLKRIEAALPAAARTKVGFTIITIDTERDTPAALHAYRAAHKLPSDTWTLLHGGPDDTQELAALLGVRFKRETSGQFAHSNLITVLNEQGEIIHQVIGLNQDLEDTVKRVVRAAREASRIQAAHE